MAEIIWRALDAYLAWDDPAYPHPMPHNKVGPFIPRMNDGGFLGRTL
jgi:hypothetical protein